ncbi:MAG: ComEC/Rec2 family competence protein [Planctomycetota bacterium]|jgi:beta-lactamase superfamily II metal-dependent hydrolase
MDITKLRIKVAMSSILDELGSSVRQYSSLTTPFSASLLILILCVTYAAGFPPEYKSFQRDQRIDYQPNPDDLMRIWMVYVGQGDGLLIQLPPRCNYDPDPGDEISSRAETVDVVIDGGSHRPQNETLMESFLLDLYESPVIIEHAVVTHHDADHVRGLIRILTREWVGVQSIYHNGLASYRRGKRGFSNSTTAKEAVREVKGGQLVRGMAFLEPSDDNRGEKLKDDYLIDTKDNLQERLSNDEFHGIYRDLARAVVDKDQPIEVEWYQRCVENGPFINEREVQLDRGVDLTGIEFRVIWPLERARKYSSWSETINGNSVTFRLDYGDFSMLFTGDHNQKSEERLLDHMDANVLDLLNVDVMKVPHHGSGGEHAYEQFFRRRDSNGRYVRPVLSVASMGEQGFKSKVLGRRNWQHPDPEVIRWLGGAHRVYHTLIHEKTFKWENLRTLEDHKAMYEFSHILIETDGKLFRIVEVDIEDSDPTAPATVQEIRRSHGTRWIRAE